VSSQGGNVLISPVSVELALRVARAGAGGDTAREIARVLRAVGTNDTANRQAADDLLRDIDAASGPGCDVHIVSSMWVQSGYQIQDDFVTIARNRFRAALETVNFGAEPQQAVRQINSWAAANTRNKIASVLAPGLLDQEVRLVIVNAAYLNCEWESKFPASNTKRSPFFLASGREVHPETMHGRMRLEYTEDDTVRMLALPYRSSRFSMLLFLPKDRSEFQAFAESLTPAHLARLEHAMHTNSLIVSLPKFTIASQLDLRPVLRSMGITDGFSSLRADFTGISTNGPLFIKNVLQATAITVDERGTEAGAATALGLTIGYDERWTPFKVDHPFLFLVRHNASGAVFFMGRVMDPTP
jgi:serpin B